MTFNFPFPSFFYPISNEIGFFFVSMPGWYHPVMHPVNRAWMHDTGYDKNIFPMTRGNYIHHANMVYNEVTKTI